MARDFLAGLTRRRLIGGAGAVALAPAAGRAGQAAAPAAAGPPGESQPLRTEFVLEIRAGIGPAVEIGPGSNGIRRLIPITGGTFEGPRLRGAVIPGGADWQLQRPDGVTAVEAKYTLKAGDGTLVSVTNRGIIVPTGAAAAGDNYIRTVPEFEVAVGPHDWLNKAVFVGSLDASRFRQGSVVVRVFRVI
ncbi:MAG: DUF3237 domain-containing protein [Steroidobacteraceae bacterium]